MADAFKPTVSLKGVCKSFEEGVSTRQVLSELSMQIPAGETVALLGASGSGKSTLLNILSGLTQADSGEVLVAGVDLTKLSAKERTLFRRENVGFVFQFFHLIPTLTVAENLRLPLQLNAKDDAEGQERIDRLLLRVGLSDRGETFPDRLSGGEQQRVAVCRALVHNPPLVLADEPTGNLDANTAEAVLELLLELAEESATTMMIVTHSESVAASCQRTFRLQSGAFVDSR